MAPPISSHTTSLNFTWQSHEIAFNSSINTKRLGFIQFVHDAACLKWLASHLLYPISCSWFKCWVQKNFLEEVTFDLYFHTKTELSKALIRDPLHLFHILLHSPKHCTDLFLPTFRFRLWELYLVFFNNVNQIIFLVHKVQSGNVYCPKHTKYTLIPST